MQRFRVPVAAAQLNAQAERYFRELPGAGSFTGDQTGVLVGQAGNLAQGTLVRFSLRVAPPGVVSEARFEAFGCPHVLATAAWVCEQLRGRAIADLLPGGPADWASRFVVPAEKLGRLLLIEDALRAAANCVLPAGPKSP